MKRKGLPGLPALAILLLAGCSDDAGVCPETLVSNTERWPAFTGVRLARLEFLAADNPELLVGDVVCTITGDSVAECWVPHVMDGKRLVPRFTIESADSLYTYMRLFADGMETGSGATTVDFARPVKLSPQPTHTPHRQPHSHRGPHPHERQSDPQRSPRAHIGNRKRPTRPFRQKRPNNPPRRANKRALESHDKYLDRLLHKRNYSPWGMYRGCCWFSIIGIKKKQQKNTDNPLGNPHKQKRENVLFSLS